MKSRNVCMEGSLSKYTNLINGWQPRYFILDKCSGTLEYYMDQNATNTGSPRGKMIMSNTTLRLSDEDNTVFIVETKNDSFRLRAFNDDDRKSWVAAIQSAICRSNNEVFRLQDDSSKECSADHRLEIVNYQKKAQPPILPTADFSIESGSKNESESLLPLVSDRQINFIYSKNFQHELQSCGKLSLPCGFSIKLPNLEKTILLCSKVLDKIHDSDSDRDRDLKKAIFKIYAATMEFLRVVNLEAKDSKRFCHIPCSPFQHVKELDGSDKFQLLRIANYVRDTRTNTKTSRFITFEAFLNQIRDFIGFNPLWVASSMDFPAKYFQTRSMVEAIGNAFAHSHPFIELMSISTNKISQFSLIIRTFCTLWKSLLLRDNLIGLLLFPVHSEFFRCKFDPRILYDDEPMLRCAVQYVSKDSTGAFIGYLEDSCRTFYFHFRVEPKLVIVDDEMRVTLTGWGRLVLLNSNQEFTFTFPDIQMKNMMVGDFYIGLSGMALIKCETTKAYVNLHFLSKINRNVENNLVGYLHLPESEEMHVYEGMWDSTINLRSPDGSIVDVIKVDVSKELAKYVAAPSLMLPLESRRLWKNTRSQIRHNSKELCKSLRKSPEEKAKEFEDSYVLLNEKNNYCLLHTKDIW